MLCMHSVILTELGIAVFDNNKCAKSIAFRNPAKEYIDLKKEKADIEDLADFLGKSGVTSVSVMMPD